MRLGWKSGEQPAIRNRQGMEADRVYKLAGNKL